VKRTRYLLPLLRAPISKSDRCFLKVEGQLRAIAAVRSIESLEVGERVYTIGNPSGLSKTLGEGLISGLCQDERVEYVQTTAPISPGSSGGALVDSKGALVGITTKFMKDAQNLNFAIAAEEFWR
jgi:serine protease Do